MKIGILDKSTKKSMRFDNVKDFTNWAIEIAGIDFDSYVECVWNDDGELIEVIDNATFTANALPCRYHVTLYRYEIRQRETGTLIDFFETLEDATENLECYESDDKEDGTYTPDFYELIEWNEAGTEYERIK